VDEKNTHVDHVLGSVEGVEEDEEVEDQGLKERLTNVGLTIFTIFTILQFDCFI
jgi:hypothetical protein